MERPKQKSRIDKPNKNVEKEKSPSFIANAKAFKENLKIREILRTVKMNSSMRIKAPRGSKVMQNKDFNESEDIFEDTKSIEGQDEEEPPCATNTILNSEIKINVSEEKDCKDNDTVSNTTEVDKIDAKINTDIDTSVVHKSKSFSEGIEECVKHDDNATDIPTALPPPTEVNYRDRKLSLDHTMLLRREGLSHSEVDLHSIGRSPLERKSSFFRKKMDSFLKNTTEIFKRQSFGEKSTLLPSVQRRGSATSRISVSLQSLNENPVYNGECDNEPIDKYEEYQGSVASLRSTATTARSNSSVSVNVSDRLEMSEEESLADSRQEMVGSQPLSDTSINIPGLNGSRIQESLINTRAISMSSGLDSASGQRRRNPSRASRFNRVTWLASESLTDYFRSLIQEEKSEESSHQDSSSPSSRYGSKTDSKGRRMSYVRAVSGDSTEPVQSRSQESSRLWKRIPENEESGLYALLKDYHDHGIPPIQGFDNWMTKMCPHAVSFLNELVSEATIDEYFGFSISEETGQITMRTPTSAKVIQSSQTIPKTALTQTEKMIIENERFRQEILKEMVYSESVHIKNLQIIVNIYIATAHAIQRRGFMQNINTSTLFLNIPDLLNANLRFWERTITPMLRKTKDNNQLFDSSMLMPGFYEIDKILDPYEIYMQNLPGATKYIRSNIDCDFLTYLCWCDKQAEISGSRLQLTDMLAKPMQRLTKYSLLLARLKSVCIHEKVKLRQVSTAENVVKAFITHVNRSCRQKEEMDKLKELKIEPYKPDFKGDDEMEKAFNEVSALNLLMPMLDCAPHMMRCLIHEGNLRYKDFLKEFDARVILFTDMMLICKKQHKTPKNACHWKLQRPKIMVNRLVPQTHKSDTSLTYVILDEHGTAEGVFKLTEAYKDPEPIKTIKIWENAVNEALMSYALTRWYNKYPIKDLSIVEHDYNDSAYRKEHPEICSIEKKARSRVAAILFPNRYLTYPDGVQEIEIPKTIPEREKGPLQLHTVGNFGLQHFNTWQARGSNFRLKKEPTSGFFFSGNSHEDISVSLQRSGSSMEPSLPLQLLNDQQPSPSITVNMVGDNVGGAPQWPPTLVLHRRSSPNQSPRPRSTSSGAEEEGNENTLGVSSPTAAFIMPDISSEYHTVIRTTPASILYTASEKLYRSHQELLQRNRLAASQNYLSPGNRGSSYPPSSPTRPPKRGDAFSYSFDTLKTAQAELQKLSEVPRMEQGLQSVREPIKD